MGGSGSTTYENPAYPKEFSGVLSDLMVPWAYQNLAAQSPYYTTMQRMYEGILGSGSTVSPGMSNIIGQGATTGYMMPWYGSMATTPTANMYATSPSYGAATGGQYPAPSYSTQPTAGAATTQATAPTITPQNIDPNALLAFLQGSGEDWKQPHEVQPMVDQIMAGQMAIPQGFMAGMGGATGPTRQYVTPMQQAYPTNTYQYQQTPGALTSFLTGGVSGQYGAGAGGYGSMGGPQLDPAAQAAIGQMSATGAPFTSSAYYQAAYPVYQQALDQALAQAKESASMEGGLRGTAGAEAMGKAAASTTNEFMQYLTNLAGQSYESAQARRLQALPYAMQEWQYPREEAINVWNQAMANQMAYLPYAQQMEPISQLGTLAQGAQTLQGQQYPNLYPFLQAILGKSGDVAIGQGSNDLVGAMGAVAPIIAAAILA